MGLSRRVLQPTVSSKIDDGFKGAVEHSRMLGYEANAASEHARFVAREPVLILSVEYEYDHAHDYEHAHAHAYEYEYALTERRRAYGCGAVG
jgi:hypothetical protein